MKMTLKIILRALCVCLALVGTSTSAFATHLRGTTINWSPTGTPGEVQFTIQYSQRTSFGGCSQVGCPVGSTLNVPFNFGDGSAATSISTTITSVNTAEDYLASTGTIKHKYAGAGPYIAFYQNSARVSTIKSGHDQTLRMETSVTPFAVPSNHSPVVSEPAIITLPLQNITGFAVSASDLERDTLHYRLSTAQEMYNSAAFTCASGQPPGLSIDPDSGQVTWNTTQIVKAPGCNRAAPDSGDLWTVQFMVEDLDANGNIKSKVPLDIILKFVQSAEIPPTLILSNPGPITVQTGTSISFTATGDDAQPNSRVTLNATGLPVGATASGLNQEVSPAKVSTFSWTPTAAQVGSYVITYSVTNDTFQQVLKSVTIYVQNILPPTLTCSVPLTGQYNTLITIPLSVSDPQAGAVTVTWTVDGTLVRTDNVPASNKTTNLTLDQTFTTLGTHTVAVSATNADGKTSTCSTTANVKPADQAITFSPLPNITFGDPDIALTATSNSSLAVTYTVTGPCTIVNGAVHATGVGTCSVTANQAGNANFNAAPPVTQSFNIGQAAQAIVFNPPNSVVFGSGPITLSATGGASGNPVTFTVTGPATLVGNILTSTGTGLVVVTAHQAGDANYAAAPDVASTITVTPATQAITFTPPASVVLGSSPITLTATGGASGNPVTFTVAGPATLAGNVLTPTGTGPVVVTAHQAGNANYSAAPDVARTITVIPAPQAITFNPPTSVVFGSGPIALTATGGASGNPVTFTVTGPATLVGNILTPTGTGPVVVTAHQAASTNYSAAPDVSGIITVTPAPQAITFMPPATASVSSSIVLSATGGASGNPVTYTVTGRATVSGNVLTLIGPGTIMVTAHQAGNANYSAALDVVRSISARVTAMVVLQASNTSFSYPNSTNTTACVTLANRLAPTGTVSIYDGTTLLTTQTVQGGGCIYYYIAPALSAGSHTLTAFYNDANNANVFSNRVVLTVAPGSVTAEVDCWVHDAQFGGNITCDANPDSGPSSGYMTYSYDNGPLVVVPLNAASHAVFTIIKPAVGTHTIQITYPAQGNWAASALPLQTFNVSLAPINVALTPSAYYTTAGNAVKFTAALTSYATTAPSGQGTVSFFDGARLLGTAPVDASGNASLSSGALVAGTHSITANYSGTNQYAAATGAVTISVGN